MTLDIASFETRKGFKEVEIISQELLDGSNKPIPNGVIVEDQLRGRVEAKGGEVVTVPAEDAVFLVTHGRAKLTAKAKPKR